jgi:hypothetical protein
MELRCLILFHKQKPLNNEILMFENITPIFLLANDIVGGFLSLFYTYIAICLVSLLLTIYYLRSRKEKVFVQALSLSSLIFLIGILFHRTDFNSPFNFSLLFFIPSLINFTMLFLRKVNDNKTKLIWHVMLLPTFILLYSKLLELFLIFNIEIWSFFTSLTYFIYPISIYVYVKFLLASDLQIERKQLFINSNKICIYSFLIIQVFYLMSISHLFVFNEAMIAHLSPFIIALILVNLMVKWMTKEKIKS